MKKLLLLGALLTIGAVSVANGDPVVPTTFKTTADLGNGTSTSGTVGLHLNATGEVVAPAKDMYMLVIEPTINAGPNGDSIAFNFDDVTPGSKKEVKGGFEAKIIKGGDPTQSDDTKDDKEIAISQAMQNTFKAKLLKNGIVGTTPHELEIASIKNTEGGDVGNLTYRLATSFSATRYIGDISAILTVDAGANAGTFMNNDADVVVEVTSIDVSK